MRVFRRFQGEFRKTGTHLVGPGGSFAMATGSNAGAETGRHPLLEFRRPASVAHCLRDSGLRPCNLRAIAARAGPKRRTKRPAAQEGGDTDRRARYLIPTRLRTSQTPRTNFADSSFHPLR